MANELTIDPKVNKGIKSLVRYAESVAIQTPSDLVDASEQVKEIKDIQTKLEEQRLQFTKPLNESLRNINSFFKQFSKPLEEADKAIRGAMVAFQKTLPEDAGNQFGHAHFTTVTTIKVDDITKVPQEYLMVDETKVRKALTEGVTNIPGLSFTKEKRVSL